VSQPALALVRTSDLLPHVVLVDDDLGEISPTTLIGQLSTRVPGVGILALVGQDAMALARQAVFAGARGFVTKPLDAEEFLAALRQVVAKRVVSADGMESESDGRLVVFCAGKGGTGRTTLAINTAVSLQAMNKGRVVLVDADFAAPALDVALNVNSGSNVTALMSKLSRLDAELISSVLAPHASGIQVLLAPPPGDSTAPMSLPHIQRLLAWLKRMFGWVIVDLGLPLDETAYAFLDGADRIVMVGPPEMVGLRNGRLVLDQFSERGYPRDKTWFVLNRSTLKGGLSVADLGSRLQIAVTQTIPDDQPLVVYSMNRGVPLVLSHPRSAVAQAINRLAEQLAREVPARTDGGIEEHGPAKNKSGPLSRLLRR
jgi:pilus assembly protein CpaE